MTRRPWQEIPAKIASSNTASKSIPSSLLRFTLAQLKIPPQILNTLPPSITHLFVNFLGEKIFLVHKLTAQRNFFFFLPPFLLSFFLGCLLRFPYTQAKPEILPLHQQLLISSTVWGQFLFVLWSSTLSIQEERKLEGLRFI